MIDGIAFADHVAVIALDLLTRVRRSSQQMGATLVRSIFMQPDAESVRQQTARVVEQLEVTGFSEAATMLAEAQEEILAFAAFPKEFWKQTWSNNPQERLNKETRRRTDVVGRKARAGRST